MFGIAKETGWSDETIMDMPIGRVWSYRHALLRSYDNKTYYITSKEERQEMSKIFKSL